GEQNPFAQTIGEFVSPFALRTFAQFPFYPELPIWTYRVLAILSVPAALVMARQRRWWMVFLWLAVGSLSIKMVRNVPLFVLGMLPGLVWALPLERGLAWFRMSAPRRRVVARASTVFAILFALGLGLRVVHNAYYVDARRADRFGLGWSAMK